MSDQYEINVKDLPSIQASMSAISSKIQEISSGGYVTKDLFQESKGGSVEAINEMVSLLLQYSKQMETLVTKTSDFISKCITEYKIVDDGLAVDMNLAQNVKAGQGTNA